MIEYLFVTRVSSAIYMWQKAIAKLTLTLMLGFFSVSANAATQDEKEYALHMSSKDYSAAVVAGTKLVRDRPDSAEQWYRKGRAETMQGVPGDALLSFAKAEELDPGLKFASSKERFNGWKSRAENLAKTSARTDVVTAALNADAIPEVVATASNPMLVTQAMVAAVPTVSTAPSVTVVGATPVNRQYEPWWKGHTGQDRVALAALAVAAIIMALGAYFGIVNRKEILKARAAIEKSERDQRLAIDLLRTESQKEAVIQGAMLVAKIEAAGNANRWILSQLQAAVEGARESSNAAFSDLQAGIQATNVELRSHVFRMDNALLPPSQETAQTIDFYASLHEAHAAISRVSEYLHAHGLPNAALIAKGEAYAEQLLRDIGATSARMVELAPLDMRYTAPEILAQAVLQMRATGHHRAPLGD